MTTALTAFRDGASTVSVFEKRSTAPGRQHWFDADPRTMQMLNEWGLDRFVHVPMELEASMPGYATFQCHMLERFLALVAFAASYERDCLDEIGTTSSIIVQRGVVFERFEGTQREVDSGDEAPSMAVFRHSDNSLETVTFDLLFACDGANSDVRKAAGVKAELQGTFLPFREEMGTRRDENIIRRKQEEGITPPCPAKRHIHGAE